MNLFRTNVTAFPGATTTCTRKEWQEHCANHDITFFLNGQLYEFRVKNIGSGMLQLSARPWTEPNEVPRLLANGQPNDMDEGRRTQDIANTTDNL